MIDLNFVKPNKVNILELTPHEGLFEIKPLNPGFGVTVGNSLRRVLLSSLEGFAITSIRIEGISHEFSVIKGIVEDVTEIVLNLKKVRFKKQIESAESETVSASVTSEEVVTAGDLGKFISSFQVLNPDLVLCNKDKSTPFNISFTIEKGRGYVPAGETNEREEGTPLDFIAIDAIYTPIKNVKYTVESHRVGQKTDFENLLIEIKTDGSINPKDALDEASNILVQHFVLFSGESVKRPVSEIQEKEDDRDEEFLRMRQLLKLSSEELGFSARTKNCLKAAKIKSLGELASMSLNQLSLCRNLGKKSLDEIVSKLNSLGVSLKMDISKYKLDKD